MAKNIQPCQCKCQTWPHHNYGSAWVEAKSYPDRLGYPLAFIVPVTVRGEKTLLVAAVDRLLQNGVQIKKWKNSAQMYKPGRTSSKNHLLVNLQV